MPKVRTTLSLHPELAYHVGLVVAEYASLERLLFSIYAILATTEPEESLITFYSLRSLRKRKALVRKTAKQWLKPAYSEALKRLLRRFSNAATRRTEVAHCEYLADDVTVMRLELSDKKARYVKLTADFFESTFNQYHMLGTDLVTYLATLATDLGREDRVRQVMRVVPRAPELKIPLSALGLLDPPTQFEIDEHKASLARLGFHVAPPP